MAAHRGARRRIIAVAALAMLAGCGAGVAPGTATPDRSVGRAETPAVTMTAPPPSPAGTSESLPAGTPAATPVTSDGRTHTPAGFDIDVALPPSFRGAWDDATYTAILDGLDPERRVAVEAVGPPLSKMWLDVYAVDTASTPRPGGCLTMLWTRRVTNSAYKTLDELEAAARTEPVPPGAELVGVERLAAAAGPLVRVVLRIPIDVRQTGSPYSTGEGSGTVGGIEYQFIWASEYGLTIDVFAFIIPVRELGRRTADLDEIMATLQMRPTSGAAQSPGISSTP